MLNFDTSKLNKFHIVNFINSLSFFIVGYLLVRGGIYLWTLFFVKTVGITHYRIFLDIFCTTPSSSDTWNYSNILSIYLSPVVISGVIFLLLFIIYRNTLKYIKGIHKLFWLWLLIHSLIMCLGGIISSVIAQTGAYYALLWMYMPYSSMMVLSLVCFLILLFLGWVLGKNFLYITKSHKIINSFSKQKSHLVFSFFLPSLVGNLMIHLFQNGVVNKYNDVLLVCSFIATIPVMLHTKKVKLTLLKNDPVDSISVFAVSGLILGSILLFIL